jgi:hypothetical protein
MPDPGGRAPAFYDHETEEPRATGRRRRQVADWGVGEDAFDRLPSRRFGRRGEERRHVARHEDFTSRDFDREDLPPRGQRFARGADDAIGAPHREVSADWPGEPATRHDTTADQLEETATRREAGADWLEETATRREAVADWLDETATGDDAAASWLEEAVPPDADVPLDADGETELPFPADEAPRRTIVIGGAVEDELPPPHEAPDTPRPRRTIVIGGHPDGLPVVRQRRPAPTAMERVGTRPDRFVAYAVAMGFLLILIAILSTGH